MAEEPGKRPQDDEPLPQGEARGPEEQKDEPPKHYATRSQRIFAWIAAIGVIIITLAYIYALGTGLLFKA